MGSALELGISFEKENERLMQEAAADAADTDAITLSTYGTYRRKPAMMHRSAHPGSGHQVNSVLLNFHNQRSM